MEYIYKGYGKAIASVTTSAAQTALPTTNFAYECSLHNTGSVTIYAVVNTATGDFVLANSIPIAAGMTYTWGDSEDHRQGYIITSVTYATSSSTSSCNIAFS